MTKRRSRSSRRASHFSPTTTTKLRLVLNCRTSMAQSSVSGMTNLDGSSNVGRTPWWYAADGSTTGVGDFLTPPQVAAEEPVFNIVGYYQFDWVRMLQLNFPPWKFFTRLQIGSGAMTIRRVDQGSNFGFTSDSAHTAAGHAPALISTRPTKLRVHYLRLPPDMSTTINFQNVQYFVNHPLHRSRDLLPGRKLTFKFRCYKNSSPDTIQNLTRTYRVAGVISPTPEVDRVRTFAFASKRKAIRSVPVAILRRNDATMISTEWQAPTQNFQPAGMPEGNLMLLSPTLLVMYENITPFGSYTRIVGSSTMSYTPAALPLVTRSESCRAIVSGYPVNPVFRVGLVSPLVQFDTLPVVAATAVLPIVMTENYNHSYYASDTISRPTIVTSVLDNVGYYPLLDNGIDLGNPLNYTTFPKS